MGLLRIPTKIQALLKLSTPNFALTLNGKQLTFEYSVFNRSKLYYDNFLVPISERGPQSLKEIQGILSTSRLKFHIKKFKEFFQPFFFMLSFVKAGIIVISVYLKLSTLFAVSHSLRVKMFPKWKLSLGFGIQKKSPFNGGSRYKIM